MHTLPSNPSTIFHSRRRRPSPNKFTILIVAIAMFAPLANTTLVLLTIAFTSISSSTLLPTHLSNRTLVHCSWSLCIAPFSFSIMGPLSYQSHIIQLNDFHFLWLSYWHWRPPIIICFLPRKFLLKEWLWLSWQGMEGRQTWILSFILLQSGILLVLKRYQILPLHPPSCSDNNVLFWP